MLATWILLVAVAVGAVAGILIGAVVGGIVVVPCLIQIKDISIQTAIASAMMSYIAAGITGGVVFARHNPIDWDKFTWILAGAVPGGFAGAFVLQFASDLVVKAILYVVIVVTTTFSLLRHVSSSTRKSAVEQAESDSSVDVNEHDQSQQTTFCVADTDTRASVEPQEEEKGVEHQDEEEGEPEEDWNTGLKSTKTVRGLLGLVVGFGSAMTGTSGPVLLLPLLILLKWPILPSLSCAQVIQIPIAVAATISYLIIRPKVLDPVLGACIACGMVPTIIVGATIAHRLPQDVLKLVVLVVLLVASVVLVIQFILSFV